MTEETAQAMPRTRRIQRTGLESVLDFSAVMMLFIGIVVTCSLAWACLATGFRLDLILWCGLAVACFWFAWLVLRWMAELIRIQKQRIGIPFDGHISGPYDETVNSCSSCGAVLISDFKCDCCDARIIDPINQDDTASRSPDEV
ncbi:hypothetical protein [Rhodopirellula sp. MGV]|uniref:hypothetical protein n=1 Tax=Rhodopirellula sp. MGV TaxID=2023130 RepID=UPI000BD62C99|nr:hypothetical protein [Rhodopirellula sp. MGV]OYP30408.1 hypothetical protein CGZ80_22395 [Rhodopirellula sp. MGV]